MDFELFRGNRIFEILYPPFTPFNKLDLKGKKKDAGVAMQTYRNVTVIQSNYFVKLGSLLLISDLSFLWSQTPVSTEESGGSRV